MMIILFGFMVLCLFIIRINNNKLIWLVISGQGLSKVLMGIHWLRKINFLINIILEEVKIYISKQQL